MKNPINKENKSSAEKKIFHWWKNLTDPKQNLRGERAALRRAHIPQAVALESAFYDLRRLFHDKDLERWQLRKLPLVAGVLAHVSEDDPRQIAKALRGDSANHVMSDLRFRRLLRIESDEELYVSFIRLVRILKGRANVRDLAKALLFWNGETKAKWAELYYTGEQLSNTTEEETNLQEVAV